MNGLNGCRPFYAIDIYTAQRQLLEDLLHLHRPRESQTSFDNMTFDILSMMDAAAGAHANTFRPTGIDVLIVGTGFGGLTAALECYRKGHNVRILERNSTTDTSGKTDEYDLPHAHADP